MDNPMLPYHSKDLEWSILKQLLERFTTEDESQTVTNYS
jgi:hypothetical protein